MILDDHLRHAKTLVFTQDLSSIQLDEKTWHHLSNTLRIGIGDLVAVGDGKGLYQVFQSQDNLKPAFSKVIKKRCSEIDFSDYFTPMTELRKSANKTKETGVGISLCKTDKIEWAVQKLTEVGVGHIWLILAERSQVRHSDPKPNYLRLQKILQEAASQARRLVIPTLHELLTPEEAYKEMSILGEVAMAEPGGNNFSADLSCVMIGPEGGWSPAELLIGEHVRLSSGILRVETAATVAGYLLASF